MSRREPSAACFRSPSDPAPPPRRPPQRDRGVDRGIKVSDIWHGPPFPVEARQPGPDPERTSYRSFLYFTDTDGNTRICRLEDTEWSLEIVANDGNSTVWDDLFPSDEDALAEALKSIGEDGIRSFSEGAPDAAVH